MLTCAQHSIQEYILEDLGGDYTDDMVECYVDCEFSTRGM